MAIALLCIIFKGNSYSDGQGSFLSGLLSNYVEETATSVITPASNQLLEINSIVAGSNKDRAPKPATLNTIQDNSIVSRGTILTDISGIFDEFSYGDNQIATYTVQEGDTLSFIAKDYGVSTNTILWANNLKSADDVKPGLDLKIPPVDGIMHKVVKGDTIASIAKKYGADPEKIVTFNSLPQGGDLQEGEDIVVPDGKIQAPAPAKKDPNNVFQPSTAKRFANLPNLGDFFLIPTTGYDWGKVHGRNGVDIANSCGTPIHAAADGVINLAKTSGYNGGFGKYIRITHTNNTETLYGHLSELMVEVGEAVTRGQEIGLMGTTGNSTGCHLHFEVHGAKNPLAKN